MNLGFMNPYNSLAIVSLRCLTLLCFNVNFKRCKAALGFRTAALLYNDSHSDSILMN